MSNGGKEKYSPLVCIAGAGSAGISAAICAGKKGWMVHLVEREERIGGTVRRGQLHTLTGFLGPEGEVIDSPVCREFIGRAGPFSKKVKKGKYWVVLMDNALYAEITAAWLAEFPSIHIHTSAYIDSVVNGGGRIRSVTLRENGGTVTLDGDLALIDATGDAALAALTAPGAVHSDHSYDSYALTLTAEIQGPPPGLMQRVALKARLEKALPGLGTSVWIDNGSAANKIAVKINSGSAAGLPADAARITEALLNLPGLNISRVVPSEACNRNGAQIQAENSADSGPEHSFLVSWPYETWRGGEVQIEDPPAMPFYLSENYLKARGYANLFAAGKSAGIPRPYASAARAVGSCWTMGEQVVKMIARGPR